MRTYQITRNVILFPSQPAYESTSLLVSGYAPITAPFMPRRRYHGSRWHWHVTAATW